MQATQSPSTAPKTSNSKPAKGAYFKPLADIFETQDVFGIVLDMPGVTSDDIEISLENRLLTVGTRAEKALAKAYFRQFRLNELVNPTEIQASLENGVLELILPKRAESKRKIISLSTH